MSGAKATNGIIEYSGANTPGWISNLGISLASGTLTIVDAEGAALSPTNPGWVTVPNTTAGLLKTLKVTAPASFNDDAHASSSDLTGLGFGITESAAWGNDMPFFLYVINRANSNIDGADGSSVFALARNPCLHTSPSAANDIGDTGSIPVNDSQNVILILDDVTVANYTSLPMQLIGAIRMQWSSANTDWTVQTLGNTDGLGEQALNKTFATRWQMPAAQNGASSGTLWLPNGGTAPTFSGDQYKWELDRNGRVHVEFNCTGDGGTDGAGAVNARLSLPCTIPSGQCDQFNHGAGYFDSATTLTSGAQVMCYFAENTSYVEFRYLDAAAVPTAVTNAMFSNGGRNARGSFTFNAFSN